MGAIKELLIEREQLEDEARDLTAQIKSNSKSMSNELLQQHKEHLAKNEARIDQIDTIVADRRAKIAAAL